MIVEIHLLQNFAPSCLNRDDTNSPKDCEFGGFRRARISSQCIKRAIRRHFASANLLPREHLAERSKRLVKEVSDQLQQKGRSPDQAAALVRATLGAVGLHADESNETQYLLFLGRREIASLAELVDKSWDTLASATAAPADAAGSTETKKAKTAKQKKAEAKEAVPPGVAKQIKSLFDGGKAADLALFGRMLADQPALNRDAACQVAHAISSNRVSMEMDYYTAVDDLKEREEETGASMIGTVEFNSACFYRYANIDLAQLQDNLQDDAELARKTVEAFLRASVEAIPTGKQNSMAAQNPPSLVFAVVRKSGLWSLANAFERPIRPDNRGDGFGLVANSIRALDEYWGRLSSVYGANGIVAAAACKLDDEPQFLALAPYQVDRIDEVVATVGKALDNAREQS